MASRIKMNDIVKVLTGKDKGKTGKVIQILPDDRMVVVEGINKMYKNIKPQKRGDKGQRVEFSAPVYFDKVMIVCPKCKKPTRIGMRASADAKHRTCKKCNEMID